MPIYIANETGFYKGALVKPGAKITTDKPMKEKPSWLDLEQSTVELSPQQKAAATRAAAKAAKAAEVVEVPDFTGTEAPEQL